MLRQKTTSHRQKAVPTKATKKPHTKRHFNTLINPSRNTAVQSAFARPSFRAISSDVPQAKMEAQSTTFFVPTTPFFQIPPGNSLFQPSKSLFKSSKVLFSEDIKLAKKIVEDVQTDSSIAVAVEAAAAEIAASDARHTEIVQKSSDQPDGEDVETNKPKPKSATFFERLKIALSRQTYESPLSKAIIDLPPLGDTAYLTDDNEEWELVYKTGLRNSLYYVKKMSITSFIGGISAIPFIFLFPNEAVPPSARIALALGCLLFGVGTTIVTNVYCSAAITQAFLNRRYPNIMEITTAGFTGNRESFRFNVTENTTDNIDNLMMTWQHVESGRYFWNNEVLVRHPVWGLIIPHLFVVPEEEEQTVENTSNTTESIEDIQEITDTSVNSVPTETADEQVNEVAPSADLSATAPPRPTRSQKFANMKQQQVNAQQTQLSQQQLDAV